LEPVHVEGHCYCGGVRLAIDLAAGERPVFTAYCHCDSCRRSHAAPLYQVVCVKSSQFKLTQGEDLVASYSPEDSDMIRAFCSTCGTRLFNKFHSRANWVATFPNLLEKGTMDNLPVPLRAHKNIHDEGCVLQRDLVLDLF